MGSTFVIMGLLARSLSPEQFGAWAVLLATAQLVTTLDIGLGAALRNRVSNLLSSGALSEVRNYVFAATLLVAGLGGLVIAGALAFGVPPSLLGLPSGAVFAQSALLVILAAAITVPLGMVVQLFYCWIEAYWIAALDLGRIAMQLTAMVTIAGLGGGLFPEVGAYFGSAILFSIVGAALMCRRRHWGLRDFFTQPHWWPQARAHIRSLAPEAGLFAFMAAAGTINSNADAIIIAHTLSVDAVGNYSVVQRLFAAATGLHLTFFYSHWGAYAVKYSGNDFSWLKRAIKLYSLFTILYAVAISVITIVAGPWIVKIWTSKIVTDTYLYAGFGAFVIISTLTNHISIFLNAIGRTRRQATILTASVIVNVPIAIVLCHHLGAVGVVISTTSVTSLLMLNNILEARSVLWKAAAR